MLTDRICVALRTHDVDDALALARAYRSCTNTVVIGPTLMVAEGARLLRQLQTVSSTEMVLDARLTGTEIEIREAVLAASQFFGMRAITVLADYSAPAVLRAAVRAAADSKNVTRHVRTPEIVAYDPELYRQAGHTKARAARIAQLVHLCERTGVQAATVTYEDIPRVRADDMCLQLFVRARRRGRDYTTALPAEAAAEPGVSEILAAGADHVVFDTGLVQEGDFDWASDMLRKELNGWLRESGNAELTGVSRKLLRH
jgi:orotidine-5'-phosphate decarboxylase